MVLIGAPLMIECTQPTYGGCLAHDYMAIGALIILISGAFALVGFVSILAYHGKEVPRTWGRVTPAIDPLLEARAERLARLAFVGIIAIGLTAAETFFFYSTVQVEGFDPVFTPIDAIFYVVADIIVLFFVYLWTGLD